VDFNLSNINHVEKLTIISQISASRFITGPKSLKKYLVDGRHFELICYSKAFLLRLIEKQMRMDHLNGYL